MDIYVIIATASLAMQVSVFFLLLCGFALKVRKRFRHHGIVMLSAVALHAVTIFIVMIPSFIVAVIPEYIVRNPEKDISILATVHGTAGLAAFFLGVWLVASWRFKAEISNCFARKKFMRATIALWITALILGISIYLYFYLPVLIG